MYEIKRKHRNLDPPDRVWEIYTREEAEEKGISYTYWKDATPETKFLLTDDNFVSPVIKLAIYPHQNPRKQSMYLNLPFTNRISYAGMEDSSLLFLPCWEKKVWYRDPGVWEKKIDKSARWKSFGLAWALMTLNGHVDYEILGRIVKPWHKNPKYYAKIKLKNKRVRDIGVKALGELLSDANLKPDQVLRRLGRVMDIAEEQRNPKELLAAVKYVIELHGLQPQRVVTTQQIEGDFSKMLGETEINGTITGKKVITSGGDDGE